MEREISPEFAAELPGGPDVAEPVTEDRRADQVGEVANLALAACHRLGKFFDAVREDDPATGLWLLDVLQNIATDNRPRLDDPRREWTKVQTWFIAVGHPTEPLPPLPCFASELPTPADIRRKVLPSAVQAALFAPGHLLADLIENCAHESVDLSNGSNDGPFASAARFDWVKTRAFLGDQSGHFFYAMQDQIRNEVARALLTIERINQRVLEATSSDGELNSVHADGPEPDSRDFWFTGQCFEMPRGNVTALINYLWSRPGREASVENVIHEIWTRRHRDAGESALPSLRRHCNTFFDGLGIPLAVSIETRGDQYVRITSLPQT